MTRHPNDPLREVAEMKCWPPGQPPVTPLSEWGPSVGVLQNSRGWYWKPELLPGYVPKLMRLSARSKSTVTGLYNVGVSPRLLIAFLDPNNEDTPTQNSEFAEVPTTLIDPLSAEVLFFAGEGTWDVVNATNNGRGYEFPMRTPMLYHGIWVGATRFTVTSQVQVTPVIQYVKKGVGQGG